MKRPKAFFENTAHEVNLKVLAQRLFERIPLFFLCAAIGFALSYLYYQIATPVFQANASLIVDRSGANRQLGRSEYIGGKFNLIEMKKNLFNEKGILESYELALKAMRQLDFEVSYYTSDWYGDMEHYGYFPFEVILVDSSAQLFDTPFRVEILSDKEYRLSIKARNFTVSNPANNTVHEVSRKFEFSKTFAFGEPVIHDYFHFTVNKPLKTQNLNGFQDKKLRFRIHSREALAQQYLDKLQVQVAIGADILQMRIRGPVANKEIAFLQRLSTEYITGKMEEREEIAIRKEEFIREQLADITDSLAQAEDKLASFQKNSQAVSLAQLASQAFYRVGRLASSRAQTEWEINYYESLLEYLSDSNKINKVIAPAAMGIKDPLLNESLHRLQTQYAERSRLSYFKGEKSYELDILDKQIANTTASIQENLRNLIKMAGLAMENLDAQIDKVENTLLQLPSREKQLGFYQRKATLYQNLYKYLSQELAKTDIARAEDIPDIKVLDAAKLAGNGPISPQSRMIFLIGILLGLSVPFSWIIASQSLDDTIKDVQALETSTKIPLAASIAHLDMEQLSMWQVQESFRDLCAGIPALAGNDKARNIIGFSSTIPSEGKTFCAFHLARNLAMSSKTVLLIDADFRVPSGIKERVAIDTYGLSDYLMDEQVLEEDIIYTDEQLPYLHYLPTRIEDRNPQAILASNRLRPLIEKMKTEYDYIIIDSPALGLVSDYLLLSPLIDIHLFIVRRNYSRLSFLPSIEKLQEKGNIEHLYLVLNDVPGKSFKYGYSYKREKKSFQGLGNLKLMTKPEP